MLKQVMIIRMGLEFNQTLPCWILKNKDKSVIPGICCCCLVITLCPTLCDPMDCSCQAPLSMGFPRQGYWSGLPFPSPGDLPDPGTEPRSPGFREIPHPPSHQGYTCNTTVLDLVTISSPVHYSLFVFYVC